MSQFLQIYSKNYPCFGCEVLQKPLYIETLTCVAPIYLTRIAVPTLPLRAPQVGSAHPGAMCEPNVDSDLCVYHMVSYGMDNDDSLRRKLLWR